MGYHWYIKDIKQINTWHLKHVKVGLKYLKFAISIWKLKKVCVAELLDENWNRRKTVCVRKTSGQEAIRICLMRLIQKQAQTKQNNLTTIIWSTRNTQNTPALKTDIHFYIELCLKNKWHYWSQHRYRNIHVTKVMLRVWWDPKRKFGFWAVKIKRDYYNWL